MQRSSLDGTTVRHPGPPLILLGALFVALFVGSLVAERAFGTRVMAFLQFGAAIPLGLFTATLVSRLRFLGIEAAGVTIALFGGFAASFFLAASALTQWVLASPGVADVTADARMLQLLAFATGGPGHVVPLGLLLAGGSITGGLTRKIPRWLMWFGVVIAVFAELSTLTLILEPAIVLLPLARFPAFIWMLCIAATLPAQRPKTGGAARTTS